DLLLFLDLNSSRYVNGIEVISEFVQVSRVYFSNSLFLASCGNSGVEIVSSGGEGYIFIFVLR
ncbi:MAG: hypothetical protein ACTSUE_19875, partial [Promethearchaeota archaeon]